MRLARLAAVCVALLMLPLAASTPSAPLWPVAAIGVIVDGDTQTTARNGSPVQAFESLTAVGVVGCEDAGSRWLAWGRITGALPSDVVTISGHAFTHEVSSGYFLAGSPYTCAPGFTVHGTRVTAAIAYEAYPLCYVQSMPDPPACP